MPKYLQTIPDRWLDYIPSGKRIGDSPFIAFKVPLKPKILTKERKRKAGDKGPTKTKDSNNAGKKSTANTRNSTTPSENKDVLSFAGNDMLPIIEEIIANVVSYSSHQVPDTNDWTPRTLLQEHPDLELVIDLTNTDRYYNGKCDLNRDQDPSHNVEYAKIFTPGHQVPDNNTVSKFFSVVDHFLHNNNNGLIGVHCTHGVNRTGYMICRYLVQRLKWDPEQALKVFADCRGHPIERQNYVKDVRAAAWNPIASNINSTEETNENILSKKSNKRHKSTKRCDRHSYDQTVQRLDGNDGRRPIDPSNQSCNSFPHKGKRKRVASDKLQVQSERSHYSDYSIHNGNDYSGASERNIYRKPHAHRQCGSREGYE